MTASLRTRLGSIVLYAAVVGVLAFATVRVVRGVPRNPALQAATQQNSPPEATARPSPSPANRSLPIPMAIQPEELAKELSGDNKPVVVCVGPHALYQGAHVPGAIYRGPASTAEGVAKLRVWAGKTDKDTNIVLYCGCCPLTKCPNVRPALATLQQMGFTHVRVLYLPNDFHTDWTGKNLPVEGGR